MLTPTEVDLDAPRDGFLSAQRLSPALIGELSARNGEPDWLLERRLVAGRIYEALPLPRWQRGIRGWWTTDLSALHLEGIAYSGQGRGIPNSIRPAASRRGLATQQAAGTIEQRDSTVVLARLDDSLAAQGVVFADLARAAVAYPDLVRPHLGALVRPEEDKFLALHTALWTGGVLVYVPSGVEVILPLRASFRLETPQSAMFVHTLLIAEPGSRVTYLEEYSSPNSAAQGLHSGVVEVYAKQGAEVQFVTIHNWGDGVFDFARKQAVVQRDARFRWVTAFLGGALCKATIETHLQAPGASLEALGLFFAAGQQHFDLCSRTYHEAAHTTGDMLFKGVVAGAARSALEGLIRVEPSAQQTTSYLSDHILQLSREAKSDAIPSLEIEANDVRVSHGATVGMIDEEQLYYLMTRGLSRRDAQRIIVGGFFDPVLQRVPLPATRQTLVDCIDRKLGAQES